MFDARQLLNALVGGQGGAAGGLAGGEAAGMSVAPAPRPGSEPGRTIFQKGAPGRRAFVCPDPEVPDVDPRELLPARHRRAVPPASLSQ